MQAMQVGGRSQSALYRSCPGVEDCVSQIKMQECDVHNTEFGLGAVANRSEAAGRER